MGLMSEHWFQQNFYFAVGSIFRNTHDQKCETRLVVHDAPPLHSALSSDELMTMDDCEEPQVMEEDTIMLEVLTISTTR